MVVPPAGEPARGEEPRKHRRSRCRQNVTKAARAHSSERSVPPVPRGADGAASGYFFADARLPVASLRPGSAVDDGAASRPAFA